MEKQRFMQPSLRPSKSAGSNDKSGGTLITESGNRPSKKRSSSWWPPWADLPFEITANILNRLGAGERLKTVQFVCKAWHNVCIDPSLWHVIDFGEYCSSNDEESGSDCSESESYCCESDCESDCFKYDSESEHCSDSESELDCSEYQSESEQSHCPLDEKPENMCCYAVDLSKGKLEDITIKDFASVELLAYIAERSKKLKRLQLVCCDKLSDQGLMEAIKSFPNLEEFSSIHRFQYFRSSPISFKTVETIGKSCPLLWSFALNTNPLGHYDPLLIARGDEAAYAIARSMPELRRLELHGNGLTDEGLIAILDGCPHLETLDLDRCIHVKLKGDLRKRCSSQIKYLTWKAFVST